MAEVFLSHNSKDKPWVRELHAALGAQGITDIFLDEYSIGLGEELIPALEKGLEQTRMFILIWSANAAVSGWVEKERQRALILHTKGITRRIVPICLDDTPLPGFLELFVRVDAQTPARPRGRSLPELADQLRRALEQAREE